MEISLLARYNELLYFYFTDGDEKKKKKTKQYTWSFRTPDQCLKDLISVTKETAKQLREKFKVAVTKEVKDLAKIFDLEESIRFLEGYEKIGNKLVASRESTTQYETHGDKEFKKFYKSVCDLPHVKDLYQEEPKLNLLPHHHSAILTKYRSVLRSMVFESHTSSLFTKINGEEIGNKSLVKITPKVEKDLDQVFTLNFEDGSTEEVLVDESKFSQLVYTDQNVYAKFGREVCIALDVALASEGCEAIVEGFYSLVKAHKKNGKQKNSTITERAIVDWCLPLPISCPETIYEITKLYLEGDKEKGLNSHRNNRFFDTRQRASTYKTSKVIDRHEAEKGRCPHVLA